MEASELKEILEQHRLWIETNKVQGKRATLHDSDLHGSDLTGANLEGASLYRANLYRTYLIGANLTGAILYRANLTGANLYLANLTDVNLVRVNFCDATLTGANLICADLNGANLNGANLTSATLTGANLVDANLTGAIGLPHVSWIIPGCLAKLNKINLGFWLEKEGKRDNFIQDSIGFFIQDNVEEKTFDILVENRIIGGIPDWVKYSGLKQIESESV